MSDMSIDEAIIMIQSLPDKVWDSMKCEKHPLDMAIEALEFQKEYPEKRASDFNSTSDSLQNGFKKRVQKCIEKIEKDKDVHTCNYRMSVYKDFPEVKQRYESVMSAFDDCLGIIQQEMGCNNE